MSGSTKTPITKYYEALLHLYPFPIPFPKAGTADFRASFRSFMQSSEETKDQIELLMSSRNEMVRILSANVPAQSKLSLVEAYLTELYTLYESLTIALSNNQNIIMDKELVFEWTVYLGTREAFQSNNILFEIITVTHLKVRYIFLFLD
jgi:hypothetical protein